MARITKEQYRQQKIEETDNRCKICFVGYSQDIIAKPSRVKNCPCDEMYKEAGRRENGKNNS